MHLDPSARLKTRTLCCESLRVQMFLALLNPKLSCMINASADPLLTEHSHDQTRECRELPGIHSDTTL